MEPTSNTSSRQTGEPGGGATHLAVRASLPSRIAGLCSEENTSLTRPTGDATVIPRKLDPNEKQRTTGARTAG